MAYWVTLKSGETFCMTVDPKEFESMIGVPPSKYSSVDWDKYDKDRNQFLMDAATRFGAVEKIETLPYPAMPQKPYKEGYEESCPAFCYTPRECAGKNSCPRSRSCCD